MEELPLSEAGPKGGEHPDRRRGNLKVTWVHVEHLRNMNMKPLLKKGRDTWVFSEMGKQNTTSTWAKNG